MMAGLSPVIVRWSKGWFILLPKVLYVDTETLSIALRAHPLFLTIRRGNGDGRRQQVL